MQIGLLLERADRVINVCEMKYAADAIAIGKAYDAVMARKVSTFAGVTKTRMAVHLKMVTSAGLVRNAYAGRVQSEVTLDDLFARNMMY